MFSFYKHILMFLFHISEPQDEDEEVIIDYLEKLILDKNLEQVDLVLKYMYR